MTRRLRDAVLAGGAIAALIGAIALQRARDRWYPRDLREPEQILYVRSGEAMKRLTLSYDALAADLYWIRAIQHYGGDRLGRQPTRRRYELLYPLLDLTTTLDPYFNIAYRFGAVFLGEAYPGGAGRPDQAVALLRKGLAAQPRKWQYYHDAAFVYFWYVRDYVAAADWFRRAAAQPGAPNWLEPLAASMLARGGDRAASRFLWQQILTSEQAWLRRGAERALLQLDAMDLIDHLEARIRSHALPAGERYSWEVLVRRGVLPGIPVDPAGVPFEIDPSSGAVVVSAQSPLYPMPGDPSQPLR